jgi:hypothetical protein
MVDNNLPIDKAADAIDELLTLCQNDNRPSVDRIVELAELADELREASAPHNVPSVGTFVRDSEHASGGPELEVVDVHPYTPANEFTYKDDDTTVAEANYNYPPTDPVVDVRWPGSEGVYHYPVSRLDY